MSFRIVTVSDKSPTLDYYCYQEFFNSIRNQGIEPLHIQEFGGLGSKPRLLYRVIKDGLVSEDIIIFVDSWDLVFIRNIHQMVELFKTKDADVIVSAEENCFPPDYKEKMDEMGQGYLNSGFIIGYTNKVKLMLEAMDAENIPNDYHDENGWHHFNDQTMFQKVYTEQPVKIKLDTDSEFCRCMYPLTYDDLKFFEGGVEVGGKYPYLIHWNGGSKTLGNTMNPILKHLGLR